MSDDNRTKDHVAQALSYGMTFSPEVAAINSALIHLAAEMVRGTSMPSPYWDDWHWYRSTPMGERRMVIKAAEKANEQCRQWAIRLREIADQLPKTQPVRMPL